MGLLAVVVPENVVLGRFRRLLALEPDIIDGFQIGNIDTHET